MKKILPLLVLIAFAQAAAAQTSFTLVTVPCNNNGILQVSFATGTLTPPLTVTWQTSGTAGTHIIHTGVSGLSDVLTGYSGGPVFVIGTDASGATDTGTYFGRAPFMLCPLTVHGGMCPAPDTLGASVCLGGMPPFTYQWYNVANSAIAGTLNPMPVTPGSTYGVIVTDAAGCTYGSLVDPLQAFAYYTPSFTTSVATTTASCTDGTAAASVAGGGVAPFTYTWSTGATTPSIGSLLMGTYSVTVTDATGCYATAFASVSQSIGVTAAVIPTPASCAAANGTVLALASGGATPYTYLWNNGATGPSQSGLTGGAYSVTVTDANGCIGTGIGFIGAGTPVAFTYTATPSLCTSATGTAALTVSGGTAPYNITWLTTPMQTGYSAASLAPGTYTVRVADAGGCEQIGTIAVPPADVISASFLSTPAVCTASNGSLTVYPTGGVAPYHYVWSTGTTAATINSHAAGKYSVTITDAVGCSATEYSYLPSNSRVNVGAVSAPASCIYANDGINSAMALGGTPPYSYGWSTGGITSTISALPSGPYWVFATDASGCTTAPYYSPVDYDTVGVSCFCTITGTVYNDANGNCSQDPGEAGIPNIQLHISGGSLGDVYTYTDATGYYEYKVPSGSYTIAQTVPPHHFLTGCQVNNIAFTTIASAGCMNTINFADSVDTVHDMHISTWDYYHPHDANNVINGHAYTSITVISNEGTVTEDSVMVGYKADGQFYSPSFVPAGIFSGSSYYYTSSGMPSMTPGMNQSFLENYVVPTNIAMGASVLFKDTVSYKNPLSNWSSDNTPSNNVSSLTTKTSSAFSPNFKEVSPAGTGSNGTIQYTDSVLEYMIHFQNTGAWAVINVVIIDTLDDNVDWTTLRPVFATANCRTDLMQSGTKKVVRFTLNDINLPAQSSDDLRSNGMLTYTVHIKPTLAVGAQVRNHASIYFDDNAPVLTNGTLNTLGSANPNSVQNVGAAAYNSFSIYPNPANQSFSAVITSETTGTATLAISDITGRQLSTRTVSVVSGVQSISVDASQLASGTYLVTLMNSGALQTQKLVIIK